METKHILAMILLVGLTSAGLLAALFSQKLRDGALFILVFGAVFVRKFMDVTFGGDYTYRGTIRGYEVSALDIAAWCILLATLALPRYRGKRFYLPAGFGMLGLYFAYCCFNVAISDPQQYGMWELSRILRSVIVLLAAAIFVRTRRELSIVVVAVGCAVTFLSLNAIEQRLFRGVLRPPATLDHENSLSMYLCTVGPVLLAASLSSFPKGIRYFAGVGCVLAMLAEMLTLSRTGMPTFFLVMGMTGVMCTTWKITRRKVAFALTVFIFGGALLFAGREQLLNRLGHGDSGLSIKDEFISEEGYETRGMYWRIAFAIAEDRPYGVGLNNWSYHVSKTYAARIGVVYDDYDSGRELIEDIDTNPLNHSPPAHGMAVLTWGELGMPGLVILGLVWLRWFQMGASFLRGRLNSDPMHRLGVGFLGSTTGIFLHSATEWTYRQTPIVFTFHVMMGCLASLYYARQHSKVEEHETVELDDIDPVQAIVVQR
ncbi:MAG TPA: O-antigen ligase family protein [Opitutaceae bacterium]|nr:O-antigen ligase family protein [Opitutaceae bacterium]